jgi:hypothetical protein
VQCVQRCSDFSCLSSYYLELKLLIFREIAGWCKEAVCWGNACIYWRVQQGIILIHSLQGRCIQGSWSEHPTCIIYYFKRLWFVSLLTSSCCYALFFHQLLLWIKLKLPWESSVMVLSSLASSVWYVTGVRVLSFQGCVSFFFVEWSFYVMFNFLLGGHCVCAIYWKVPDFLFQHKELWYCSGPTLPSEVH